LEADNDDDFGLNISSASLYQTSACVGNLLKAHTNIQATGLCHESGAKSRQVVAAEALSHPFGFRLIRNGET
jgi:hypothetical protein